MALHTWGWRRFLRIAVSGGLAAGALSFAAGCSPPRPNALVDANGKEVTVDQIREILDDADLNADEKKAALQDLGITDKDGNPVDDELLNYLIGLPEI